MSDDMTFCPKKCRLTECPLNSENIKDKRRPHSYYKDLPMACPMLHAVKNKMTIKQFAEKYGLDYQIVYSAIRDAGILLYGKNNRYPEESVALACSNYVFNKIDKHKREVERYLGYAERINAVLENEAQKQG